MDKVRWHGWTHQPVRQKSSKNARVYRFLLRTESFLSLNSHLKVSDAYYSSDQVRFVMLILHCQISGLLPGRLGRRLNRMMIPVVNEVDDVLVEQRRVFPIHKMARVIDDDHLHVHILRA
jgi:hypothetical protein